MSRAFYQQLFLAIFAVFLGWMLRVYDFGSLLSGIAYSPSSNLAVTQDRTNLLLLGIGGEGHEGGDLTDSMIVASLYHPTNKITLIPIPRDLFLTDRKEKINAVFRNSELQFPGQGMSNLQSAITSVINIPIHYYLQVDFAGFTKIIDSLGGIEVDVVNTFDDYKYPIPGKELALPESARYEHLHFDAGKQFMDGNLALKYVRSRHAQGEEGTDFARSQRQLLVLRAIKDKIISPQIILNPKAIQSLIISVNSSYKTNILIPEAISFFKSYYPELRNRDNLKTLSLVELLINPTNFAPYNGQWVLIPQKNWESIHEFVQKNLAI